MPVGLGKGPFVISSQPPYSPHSFQQPFVSAHHRARIVSVLLTACAVLSLASALVSLVELVFPHLALTDEEIENPEVLIMALLQIGLGLIQIVVYVVTIVAFLMWLYRSYENLPSFGVRQNDIYYSSGWAVGSFFVPFVSLVVPYRAVKELWSKSVPNSDQMFSAPTPPGFFPVWWGVWLVSNFANQIHLRLSWRGELRPEVDAMLGVVIGMLDVLAAILALMVVREIDKEQAASAELIPREFVSPLLPPPPSLDAA